MRPIIPLFFLFLLCSSAFALDYWANSDSGVWIKTNLTANVSYYVEINTSQATDTGNISAVMLGGMDFVSNIEDDWLSPAPTDQVATWNSPSYENLSRGTSTGCGAYCFTGFGVNDTYFNPVYPAIYEAKASKIPNLNNQIGIVLTDNFGKTYSKDILLFFNPSSPTIILHKASGTNVCVANTTTLTNSIFRMTFTDTTHVIAEVWNSSGTKTFSCTTDITALSSSTDVFGLSQEPYATGTWVEYDYWFARSYAETEPTVSCVSIDADTVRCAITSTINLTDYQVKIPYTDINDTNLSIANWNNETPAENCTPTISLYSPADETSSVASTQILTANVSLGDYCTNATVLFYLDGVNTFNSSLLTSNGTTSTTAQTLSLGAHTWYAFVYGDDDPTLNSTSETWDLYRTQSPSLSDGYFGYDSETLASEATIDSDMGNYSFTLYGYHIDFTNMGTDWATLKDRINYTYTNYNIPSFFTIYFNGTNGNYSTYSTECASIANSFDDLLAYPLTDGTAFIVMDLNDTGDGNLTTFTNEVAKCIMDATANKFVIYSEYMNESLDTDYVHNYTLNKITHDSDTAIDTETEKNIMRSSASLTRIYSGNNATFKAWANAYYTSIIQNLRSVPKGEAFADDDRIAEMENGDVVIFNPTESAVNYSANLTSKSPNDGWDSVGKTLYADLSNESNTSIEISEASAVLLFIDNFTRLKMTDNDTSTLYKDVENAINEQNYWDGGTSAGQHTSYGSYDLMAELWDGSYVRDTLFFSTYEALEYTQEVDFSPYEIIIIAQGSNTPAVVNASLTEAERNHTFGYMAVSDYVNDTAGTNCSVENSWETAKKAEMLTWARDYGLNIFIDGFDIGYYGGGDEKKCFEDRVKRLGNYGHSLGKKLIFNTYTIYQSVSQYGDYVMRESCFSRWDGDVSNPTYSYENMTLMIENAKYLTSVGKPVLCMAFGAETDYDKMAWDYLAFAVLYGTNGNYFRYGQPNFQVQKEIRVPNLGAQLQNKYIEASPTDWYRRYENGIAHFDPTRTTPFPNGKYYWFENGETVHGIKVYGTFWKVTGNPCSSSHNQYVALNWNTTTQYEVDECDVEANGWNNQLEMTFSVSDYAPHGHYWVWIYPKTRGDPTGMLLYSYADTTTGQHSYRKSSMTHPPTFDYNNVLAWRAGVPGNEYTTNYRFNITINRSYATAVDTGVSTINVSNVAFTETAKKGENYTIAGTKDYNLKVMGYYLLLPLTQIVGISHNGTSMGYANNADCITENPTMTDTVIDGEVHSVCTYDIGDSVYVRFESPHLSDEEYEIDSEYAFNEVNLLLVDGQANNSVIADRTPAVEFNFTKNDSATASCELWVNGVAGYGTDTAVANNTNTTINVSSWLVSGDYNISVNCTAGNFSMNSGDFNVSIAPATITADLLSPSNDTNLTNSTWAFSWYCNDSVYDSLNANLYIDGAVAVPATTCTNATLCEANVTDWTCGSHTWLVECYDGDGVYTNSSTYDMGSQPAFNLIQPANGSTVSNNANITLEVNTTCLLNASWFEATTETPLFYNYTGSGNGTYSAVLKVNETGKWAWSAFGNDTLNSAFNSGEWWFSSTGDTCNCPTGANWYMNATDNCVLNSPCNILGYSLIFIDGGNFTINETLTTCGVNWNSTSAKIIWGTNSNAKIVWGC